MARRVVITGATHGNEFIGAFMVKKWKKVPAAVSRPSFEKVECVISNPKAFRANRRFVDDDLNRCMSPERLAQVDRNSYEFSRAQALNARYGPKGSATPAFDFCLDYHTTTSSMGVTLIVEAKDTLTLRAAKYTQERMPDVRIMWNEFETNIESPHVCSMCPHGMMIEIGAIPWGLVRQDVYEQTEQATHHILDYIHQVNEGTAPDVGEDILVFKDCGKVAIPLDEEGDPTATFCGSAQDRDWRPLRKGDPLFYDLVDGTVTAYDGSKGDVVFPCFVNEAAYYYPQSGLGVCCTSLVRLSLETGEKVQEYDGEEAAELAASQGGPAVKGAAAPAAAAAAAGSGAAQ